MIAMDTSFTQAKIKKGMGYSSPPNTELAYSLSNVFLYIGMKLDISKSILGYYFSIINKIKKSSQCE